MRNQNSLYGHTAIPMPLSFGKVHLVKASGVIAAELNNSWFPVDEDGVVRVHATVAAAVAACTASQGDTILVLPGHTETFSSSTALALSVAGVSIIGLGKGSQRPTFTFDTGTDSTITASATGISWENCIFIANYAAIVAPFTLTTAKDFALLNCEFRDTSVSLNFVNIVSTATTSNAADGLKIEDCKRIGLGATTLSTLVNMLGTNDRLSVKRNFITHAATTGGGLMQIAAGKVVTNAEIETNRLILTDATNLTTGILIITNGSTNSGVIASNLCQGLDATTEILVTASSGFKFFQNFYSGTADTSGYLLPAADS